MGSSKFVHAIYNDDDVLLSAVKMVKDEKFHIEEIYTPFPVHGLDKAMGLEPTRIETVKPMQPYIKEAIAILVGSKPIALSSP